MVGHLPPSPSRGNVTVSCLSFTVVHGGWGSIVLVREAVSTLDGNIISIAGPGPTRAEALEHDWVNNVEPTCYYDE